MCVYFFFFNSLDYIFDRTPEQIDTLIGEHNQHHLAISATKGEGTKDLLAAIESGLLKATGRCQYEINIDQEGDELRYEIFLGLHQLYFQSFLDILESLNAEADIMPAQDYQPNILNI